MMMYIPTYYAVEVGLGLGTVGVIMAAGRVFDIITDPAIGLLSDKTRSRFGRRKPWMAVGLPLFCVAVWGLFQPTEGAGVGYFLFFSLLYFLAFTISELPHASMGFEISNDSDERSWLSASKKLVLVGGGLIGAAVPVILQLSVAEALRVISYLAIAATIIVLPIFLKTVPSRTGPRTSPQAAIAARVNSGGLKTVWAHQGVRRILGINFLTQIGGSFSAALSLLFMGYIIGMPEKIGVVWMAMCLGLIIGIPIWVKLSERMGKRKAWGLSNALGALAMLPVFFMQAGQWIPMSLCAGLVAVLTAGNGVLPMSILADFIGGPEQAQNSEGGEDGSTSLRNAAGLVAASKNALSKLSFGIPMLFAFPLLGVLGLKQDTLAVIDPLGGGLARTVLIGLYAGVPMLMSVIVFALLRGREEAS